MTKREQLFWKKVEITSGCWLWTGGTNPKGYGRFWDGSRMVSSHRFAYEISVEGIPEGMTIDHLCRVHSCVNPGHMKVVSNWENTLRGNNHTAVNARKTHCKRGHEFTPENTYIYKSRNQRECRQCKLELNRKYRGGEDTG